jgi:hypothetical protein
MTVEDSPDAGHPSGRHEVAVPGVVAPAMPQPSPHTLESYPYLIPGTNQRYFLGWQDRKKDGPCFVVARNGAMGPKVLDRFPLTKDGWSRAWAALVQLDAGAAEATAEKLQEMFAAAAAQQAEMDRRAQVYEAIVNAGGAAVFNLLGVQVWVGDGNVYTIGLRNDQTKTNTSRVLGPLAGAQAMVTDGSQAWSPGRAMFLPIGLAGLATKTMADAAVVFADGAVHTAPLDGNYAVREAQKQVVQFNALAGATTPAATETGGDPAVRLRKLQELRDAGLLTQDEYETKRAEIINSI